MTLDRYTMERGIDFIPAIDVDSSVTTLKDLEKLRTKIRQIYQCFDKPKFIHLGPKLTLLFCGSPLNILDYLCIPNETTTLIVCGNSLQSKNMDWQKHLPDNVIITHYGFQVIYYAIFLILQSPKWFYVIM